MEDSIAFEIHRLAEACPLGKTFAFRAEYVKSTKVQRSIWRNSPSWDAYNRSLDSLRDALEERERKWSCDGKK